MTSTHSADWRKNVKQVIRIALVGLDAGDKILIKGYMRLLLRVDFDLEWVMPKNPQVDLLIVHNQFSNAQVIQTLLNDSKKPLAALFVENNAEKSNAIEDGVLYLSLEHLAPLKEWLHDNLPIMQAGAQISGESEVESDALEDSEDGHETAFDSQNHDNQASNQLITNATEQKESRHGESSISADTIELYNSLHNRSDSDYYFDILNNGRVIATVHPKSRRVWPRGDTFYPTFSFGWSVSDLPKAQFQALSPSDERAMNLHNWLWRCAHKPGSTVEEVIPDNTRIALKFWPKPAGDSDKSSFLRMLALSEARPVNAQEIISVLKVDELIARRFLGALYMCGMANTQALPSGDALLKMQMSTQQLSDDNNTDGISPDLVEAYRQEQQIQEQASAAAQEEHQPEIVKDKKLGGILGRIRSALGIGS